MDLLNFTQLNVIVWAGVCIENGRKKYLAELFGMLLGAPST